jgi:hypothetical protein
MNNVKEFDVDKDHAGMLLTDDTVFNFNTNERSEPCKDPEDYLACSFHSYTKPNIGPIKSIASGYNFNLLITENDEIFGQLLVKSKKLSAAIAQPLDFNHNQSIHKIDMISDYNSIHGTKVSRRLVNKIDLKSESCRPILYGTNF